MIFFNNLNQYKNEIIHGVMEISDGSANPFSNQKAVENVLKSLKKLGFNFKPNNLVFADQIHSANSCFCQEGGIIKLKTDALISNRKKIVLVIKTADCLPILFYDYKNKIISAVHAGRKGLEKGIIGKTIRKSGVEPKNLIIGIGPHIKKCCYYLRGGAVKKYQSDKKYTIRKNGKIYLDLTKMAVDQLTGIGVKKENIEDSGICTFCQGKGRFFSARRREIEKNKTKEKHACFGSFIALI